MMLCDHAFGDVAARDRRAIQTVDGAGVQATFLPLEFYCTDPGCDRRRVVIQMHWVEGKRIAATISHAFERPRASDGPQTSLAARKDSDQTDLRGVAPKSSVK